MSNPHEEMLEKVKDYFEEHPEIISMQFSNKDFMIILQKLIKNE